MLAEFREQKPFLAKLPELRLTFEKFLLLGTRKSDRPFHPKNTYLWEREEVLSVNGDSFVLNVITDTFCTYPTKADLVITVSSSDGRQVREVLPSEDSLLKNHDVGDYFDLPERLAELKTVVDDFLVHRKPAYSSSG